MNKLNKHSLKALPPWAIVKAWSVAGYHSYYIKRTDGYFFKFNYCGDLEHGDDNVSPHSIYKYNRNNRLVDSSIEKREVVQMYHNIHDDHHYLSEDNEYWEYDEDEEY